MLKTSAIIALSICTVLISACSTKTPFYAMGGSRADGTVDMAYDFKPFETPIIDRNQAQSVAKVKCQVWGYKDAEAFGGRIQNCYVRNRFGTCTQGQIVEKYQCVGDLEARSREPVASLRVMSNASPDTALDREAWQNQQIKKLQDSDVSYEEYQAKYRKIMGE
jgi:hypothetical protein